VPVTAWRDSETRAEQRYGDNLLKQIVSVTADGGTASVQEQFAFHFNVLPELLAVIGGNDYQTIIYDTRILQKAEQPSNLSVNV
jgi:FMN-dependent NADH-azoreductase